MTNTPKIEDMFYKEARRWTMATGREKSKFVIGWLDKDYAANYIFDEQPDVAGDKVGKYKIVRCFNLGGKVAASVDASNLTYWGVMEFLIKQLPKAIPITEEPGA